MKTIDRLLNSLQTDTPVGQILVAALGIYGAFLLGRSLDGHRTGLIAAGLWSAWFANVAAAPSFMQERLYVPVLTLGLGLLAAAVRADGRESIEGARVIRLLPEFD